MDRTRLSSKGQVIIPKSLRDSHHWQVGQELEVIDVGDGMLLKPVSKAQAASLDDLYACLQYRGQPKTLEQMEQAIADGIAQHGNDGDDQH
jgi:AbrB family looped-hinge helix DNA binding protein